MKALMPPHDLARGRYDFTGFVINEMREELGHLDLAKEANALTILFIGNRKIEFPGNFTDPRFFDLAEGEASSGKLLRRDAGEKIRLILVLVSSLPKFGFLETELFRMQ